MCFRELMNELGRRQIAATESQIRWAIKSGKIQRPRVDGSLRFDFSHANVREIVAHFGQPEPSPCP